MSQARLNRWQSGSSIVFYLLLAGLAAVHGQSGGTWNNGNGGVGAWSNAQTGGAGMHPPPGSLSGQDPQFSYGYAGVDSRGTYGGAGGNGGYYVSSTDEHGRPFSYNGQGNQPLPGQPGYSMDNGRYPGSYGYRGAAAATTSGTLALTLGAAALLASRSSH
ncbi:heterogeneous nuclear ribonucleoprotein 87F [Drosophila guanche]|uniref:Uncharacterized protein n=1 Tax=Drosophila guanche TaxID=7266 RepID=A0A3B0J8J2_DROGU|nr:heterogeneous nuclear ribonucleoprotein 87F [Drosophila guanche]SPP78517.1 Hypothetical predicted protein [Drosophila guanche]